MEPNHESIMARAIALARKAIAEGNGPVGCLIVKDGEVIGEGRNLVHTVGDPTAHGEMEAIRNASAKGRIHDLSGSTLYSTMEPCPMCCWAILSTGICTVVLGARHARFHSKELGAYTVEALVAMTGRKLEILSGICERECEDLRFAVLERTGREIRKAQLLGKTATGAHGTTDG
jgi:tRNA(adenine34) deaminase